MKIRELLQIEIWSKSTTRKVLVGIGIVFTGFFAWCAAGQYWTTPGERRAARVALIQIDALQNLESLSNEDFSARYKQAEKCVDIARDAAWTERDKVLAFDLSAYLGLTEIDQKDMQGQKQMELKCPPPARPDQKSATAMGSVGKQVRLITRLGLHKALD